MRNKQIELAKLQREGKALTKQFLERVKRARISLEDEIFALVENNGRLYMALGVKYRADQHPKEITETIMKLIKESK